MPKLSGLSLKHHLRCILSEWKDRKSIFGLPQSKFFLGHEGLDFSVLFHARRVSTPLGPAAGPHTQMAQNIVLAYLGGARVFELKTVQILDELELPRPCIDARNICFNVEWSQELKLEESQDEYFKAWILLKMIEELELLGKPKGDPFYEFAFDLSAGYDFKGISSPKMSAWLRSFQKPQELLGKMIGEISSEFPQARNLNLAGSISDSLTLSTFHGCPKDEIETIVRHLIQEHGLHVVVKMNPTLLGYEFVRKTLLEDLGYHQLKLDEKAFQGDLSFADAVPMMKRLHQFAKERGRNFGAKFSNTLVVQNHDQVFTDRVMYLSGTPLHVLAMNTMQRFRAQMAPDFHISFSAGIDRDNFSDAVLCGMKPITTCTDLLKEGGYGRLSAYLDHLAGEMKTVGAHSIASFIANKGRNSEEIVSRLVTNPKYHFSQNSALPKSSEAQLQFFDCITCNVCIPVCPNSANFWISAGKTSEGVTDFEFKSGKFHPVQSESLTLVRPRQIANLAEFCNECGNCETFCPEDGAPYQVKPRFFLSETSYRVTPVLDGFWLQTPWEMKGRLAGQEYRLKTDGASEEFFFETSRFRLVLKKDGSLVRGEKIDGPANDSSERLNMRPFHVMKVLLAGLHKTPENFAKVLLVGPKENP
ncbi:glutamate synthase [Bdellovibrionota bacterium FG-2]